jgi:hypothetical protein
MSGQEAARKDPLLWPALIVCLHTIVDESSSEQHSLSVPEMLWYNHVHAGGSQGRAGGCHIHWVH